MSEAEVDDHRYFIDTNIWLYAFIEGDDSQKTVRAKEVIESSEIIYVSTQVINEVCVNLIKKTRFTEEQIQLLINSFYTNYVVIDLQQSILLKASELREKHKFSFWDSLITASALSVKANILYTEDMHAGMLIEEQFQIINPFDQLSKNV